MQMILATLSERNDRLEQEIASFTAESRKAVAQGRAETSKLREECSSMVQATELTALQNELDSLRQEFEARIESLHENQMKSQQPQSKWQESSVKKLEVRKSQGWAEVKMTKIEARDLTSRHSSLVE